MITPDCATAQILLILASDNLQQLHGLRASLRQSGYRYCFAPYADNPSLITAIARRVADNAGRLPAILVINWKFAGKDCEKLLAMARQAGERAAIACLVTHPPSRADLRARLVRAGARLFDGPGVLDLAELTAH